MIKVYIANLGKYNEGELVGEWLSLPFSEVEREELFVKIGLGYMNEDGEYVHGLEVDGIVYEEYAIHDYETEIDGLKIDEYDSLDNLNELAERIGNLSDYEVEELEALIEVHSSDLEECLDIIEKGDYIAYHGVDNNYDLGWEVAHACGYVDNKDSVLVRYFDYEAFGRDLTFDGFAIASNSIAICVN